MIGRGSLSGIRDYTSMDLVVVGVCEFAQSKGVVCSRATPILPPPTERRPQASVAPVCSLLFSLPKELAV
jgi:hypothetical protein